VRDVGQVDPVDHHHRQLQVRQVPAQQLGQRRAGLGHERARDRRLRRRPGLSLHPFPDRLIHPARAAGRHPGEHPLEHQPAEQIPRGELLVAVQPDLLGVISSSDPRTADLDPAGAERDLPGRVPVTPRGPLRVLLALRADDPVDLPLHRLMQHLQPRHHRQRQQPLLRLPSDPCQRQLHMLGQHNRAPSFLSLDDLDNV
jgi:hypothetical protein